MLHHLLPLNPPKKNLMSHNQLQQDHGTSHNEPKTISWHSQTKKLLVRKEATKPEAAILVATKPKAVNQKCQQWFVRVGLTLRWAMSGQEGRKTPTT